jgi:hypothetical protein
VTATAGLPEPSTMQERVAQAILSGPGEWVGSGAQLVELVAAVLDAIPSQVPHPQDAVAEAILAAASDDPMWIADDGEPLEYSPTREALIGQFAQRAATAVHAQLAGSLAELHRIMEEAIIRGGYREGEEDRVVALLAALGAEPLGDPDETG